MKAIRNMLTGLGHYQVIFQKPKYTTQLEWAFFVLTSAALVLLTLRF